jgi:hypothetical protein
VEVPADPFHATRHPAEEGEDFSAGTETGPREETVFFSGEW